MNTSLRNGVPIVYPYDYINSLSPDQKRVTELTDPIRVDEYVDKIIKELSKHYTRQGMSDQLSRYQSGQFCTQSPTLDEYIIRFGTDHVIVRTLVLKILKKIST